MQAGRRRFVWALIGAGLVLSIGAGGCAHDRYKTSANVDTEYDFDTVDTFAFQPLREKAARSSGGQVLQQALRDGLTDRGYVEASADAADVLVSYDLGRYAPAKLSGSSSFAITEGTLTVRIIDRPSGATVWYGWVETRLRTNDDDAVIGEAVDTLFRVHVPETRRATP